MFSSVHHGLEVFVDCHIHSFCCVLIFGEQEQKRTGRKGPLGLDTLEAEAVVSYCPAGCNRNISGVFVSIGDKGGHS